MATSVPSVSALTTLVLDTLKQLGGSASTAQISAAVHASDSLSSEQRAAKHGAGPGTEIQYRIRWALVDLRRRGLIARTSPRVWALSKPDLSTEA